MFNLPSSHVSEQMLFYMAVVLYSPAIALQGVTNITAWKSVVTTGDYNAPTLVANCHVDIG